jgi:catechol 2,3-dioxygenase-like lactoylglutathione lyase family enzyme
MIPGRSRPSSVSDTNRCQRQAVSLDREGRSQVDGGLERSTSRLFRREVESRELQFARMGVLGVNHLAFRTSDPDQLRRFYVALTGAEELEGAHRPIRLGQTLLVFFASGMRAAADDPDEIAFDVDLPGFDDVLERARALGCEIRGPVEHTAPSRGFYLDDPDGRRLEFTHDDRGVYWRE